MLETTENENQFVVDILSDLRKDNFGFRVWLHFLRSSWKKSCATSIAHPSLSNSWFSITIFIGLLALAIMLFNLFFEGTIESLHVLPFFLFFVIWQQSDFYWPLGLIRQIRTGTLLDTVGIATTVTLIRGLGAWQIHHPDRCFLPSFDDCNADFACFSTFGSNF